MTKYMIEHQILRAIKSDCRSSQPVSGWEYRISVYGQKYIICSPSNWAESPVSGYVDWMLCPVRTQKREILFWVEVNIKDEGRGDYIVTPHVIDRRW